jgi:hypothetical protein
LTGTPRHNTLESLSVDAPFARGGEKVGPDTVSPQTLYLEPFKEKGHEIER